MAAAVLCGATLSAVAASPEHAQYKVEKEQAKADYDIAKAHEEKLEAKRELRDK